MIVDASFVVNDKERVCLVGKNGAGKSTLLKIIAASTKGYTRNSNSFAINSNNNSIDSTSSANGSNDNSIDRTSFANGSNDNSINSNDYTNGERGRFNNNITNPKNNIGSSYNGASYQKENSRNPKISSDYYDEMASALRGVKNGSVSINQGATVGYLPQVMNLSDSRTLIEETATAFSQLREMQTRLDDVNTQLAERTDYQSEAYAKLIEQSTTLQERLQMMGADTYHADMERTLLGLGFTRSDFNRPTSEFSGGWRMRVELAKILLQRPDVLLLDEPTNHLDIESIAWLETFLIQRSKSSLILVSHDRAFINNVTTRTLEINCARVIDYKVKYDEYVKLRAERREQQLRAYQNQQKEIADIKAFIERFRYQATKANQVQSRIKQLEKIVPIEVDEVDNSTLHLHFNEPRRSGDYPLICEGLGKSYGSHCVLRNVNLTIKRGEKVAFVGKNGEGKSTLVKCIMGEIPYDGMLKVGHNVDIGYYAQNQAQLLDGELTVYDTIDHVATGEVRKKIRDILGAFMFGGEASEKKVKVLSGGERSRLAMIKLLLQPVNFLILDEPTNHLDMRTKDVLKEAVRAFKGTVIIVSHDRNFLDGLVDRLYVFGGGGVREFNGNIYDFAQLAVSMATGDTASANPSISGRNKANNASDRQGNKNHNGNNSGDKNDNANPKVQNGNKDYERQKEIRRRMNKLEKQVAESEHHISELESAIRILEDKIATPEGAADAVLLQKYQAFQNQMDEAMNAWEQQSEALGEARKELQ